MWEISIEIDRVSPSVTLVTALDIDCGFSHTEKMGLESLNISKFVNTATSRRDVYSAQLTATLANAQLKAQDLYSAFNQKAKVKMVVDNRFVKCFEEKEEIKEI